MFCTIHIRSAPPEAAASDAPRCVALNWDALKKGPAQGRRTKTPAVCAMMKFVVSVSAFSPPHSVLSSVSQSLCCAVSQTPLEQPTQSRREQKALAIHWRNNCVSVGTESGVKAIIADFFSCRRDLDCPLHRGFFQDSQVLGGTIIVSGPPLMNRISPTRHERTAVCSLLKQRKEQDDNPKNLFQIQQ